MKKYILPLLLATSTTQALDIRYGLGDFEWNMGLLGLVDSSVTVDDTVISINEQHQNFEDSPWYFFGNLDIHSSDTLDTVTDLADGIRSDFPSLINSAMSTVAPIPSSFEVSGMDIDLGIGYDVIQDERGYLGVGVVTGLSTPFMEMHNYIDSYNYISNLLEETSTDVSTYKFGLSLQAAYSVTRNISLYGTSIFALQTGEMTNDLINSTLDVSGSYNSMDIGVKFYPSELVDEESNLYLKAGYAYKHWDIDDIESTIAGVVVPSMDSLFQSEMTSDFFYVGLGFKL